MGAGDTPTNPRKRFFQSLKKQIVMPDFAVIHVEKSSGNSTGIGQHIDRTRCPANANPEKQHLNKHFIDTGNKLTKDINERIAEGYTGKKAIRKDAVKSLRFILSGSHERMKEIEQSPQELQKWVQANLDFMAETYGRENLMRFSLHLDETTPHLHAVVVPLTKDGRLSAKEVTGGPIGLEQLQDKYSEKMALFGLERGLKNSPSKHADISEFYGRINEPLRGTEVKKAIDTIPKKGIMQSSEKYQEAISKHFTPVIGEIFQQLAEARGALYANNLINPETMKVFKRAPQMEFKRQKEQNKARDLNKTQKRIITPQKEKGSNMGL